MSWKDNAMMWWNGNKITDHNRSPLDESVEQLGTDTRTANGTLRRHTIARKRTWSCSWENLPSRAVNGYIKPADGGWSGAQMEDFYYANTGAFRLALRNGSASGMSLPNPTDAQLPFDNDHFYIARVMFTEFSKEIIKRGPGVDYWNISVTMEEC